MDKLKIAISFIKIRLKNIGSVLVKGSTAYVIAVSYTHLRAPRDS